MSFHQALDLIFELIRRAIGYARESCGCAIALTALAKSLGHSNFCYHRGRGPTKLPGFFEGLRSRKLSTGSIGMDIVVEFCGPSPGNRINNLEGRSLGRRGGWKEGAGIVEGRGGEWWLSQIIVNDKYPDQTVTIEKQLPNHFKKDLQSLLKSNADIFAWTHANMTRIPRTIMIKGKPCNMEHKLNEYNHIKPIKQNKRGLGPDRNMAACKEIEELTKSGILRKVKHRTWVSNPVMVKKSDGGWRMCVDFTDINKACPKDCYPLPEID
ncbi:hypothetical protein Tco_1244914 [Tanacetum coccineum]